MTNPPDLSRGFGLKPPHHTTVEEQLQRSWPRVGDQTLPTGAGGRATAAMIGIQPQEEFKFIVVGDSGGVADASKQLNVSNSIVDRLASDQDITFMYHNGDIDYYHGEPENYAQQFYEPYSHFNRPIVGIPGNHDGDVSEDDSGNSTGRNPLDTFMQNFCDSKPNIPVCDPQFEYGRHTQTQPYCYWTLELSNLTIIGLYTNVPSGGYMDADQIAWLVSEVAAAPTNAPLIVALHHPPYSVDAHHGGSTHMGDALDSAFNTASRWPNVVMSGHVHDYQRFTRSVNGQSITYLVIGNSGYHNLHNFAGDVMPPMHVASDNYGDTILEAGDDQNWGYLVMSYDGASLHGEYVAVDSNGNTTENTDQFVVA